ncbi:MAG: hypothetical protein KKC84_02215, partial [Candidatus Omnitrophica bacterium]|nr:hypothetical protein [Candidatus Omnitrophota bacterium]
MKILITYASAGAGHYKVAESVYGYLKEHHFPHEIKLVDVLDGTNALFRWFYTFGYSWVITKARHSWWLAYWITNWRFLRPISRAIATFLNDINTDRFLKILVHEDPDVIISTHFLCSEIASTFKNAHKIHSRIITIITDFGVHQFWVTEGVDLYIVASEFTKEQLLKEGVEAEKISVLGIPVRHKFFQQYDRTHLAQKIGLSEKKFTVLVMTGSFGIGPLEDIVERLSPHVQVIVVCASNTELYWHLLAKGYEDVKVFGFVDNPHELMAISDLIITKPGGVTIAEILAMEIVPLFITPIPGQETINVAVLRKYGIGFMPGSLENITRMVFNLKK